MRNLSFYDKEELILLLDAMKGRVCNTNFEQTELRDFAICLLAKYYKDSHELDMLSEIYRRLLKELYLKTKKNK